MTRNSSDTGQHVPVSGQKPPHVVRIVAGLGAVALFVFALTGFLDRAGLLQHEYWWLMVVAMAVAVAGWFARTDWQKAGFMAAIFMIGFAAQLALKNPFWYQHVRLSSDGLAALMMAAVALQGVLGAVVLWRIGIFGHLGRIFSDLGRGRVVVILLLLLVASKSSMDFIATQKLDRFVVHWALALVFLGINMISFIALLLSLPAAGLHRMSGAVNRAISLPGSDDQPRTLDRALPVWVAGAVLVLCLLISLVSLDGVPHLDDIMYLFHAEYFANGMLSLPVPVSTEAFDHYLMETYQDKWFTVNLPGWPAALALGSLINMPWVINPLLGAASILLLHRFTQSMTDRGTANLAILLMAVSPWFIMTSATMLLHTFTYALILGAWVLLLKSSQRPSLVLSFLAGALMGWLFLSRPVEGLYMGVLTGLWTLSLLRDRQQWKTVVFFSLGAIAIGGLMFPYNAYLIGDALNTPMNVYLSALWGPGANAIGFGPEIGPPNWGNVDVFRGHSPYEALINFHQNLYELNSELFGWGGFSLVFALMFLLWGNWNRFTLAMAAIVLVTLGIYGLYWYVGGFYVGPRYWFMILVPVLIFSALGIKTCSDRFDRLFPTGLVPQRIGAGLGFLGLCSVLVFQSWQGFNKFPDINDFHDEYQDMARQDAFKNSLIFINIDPEERYGSAIWLNDFHPEADSPLFARDLGADSNRQVAAGYPDRKIFFVDGRTGSQRHIQLTRGPLSIDDLE